MAKTGRIAEALRAGLGPAGISPARGDENALDEEGEPGDQHDRGERRPACRLNVGSAHAARNGHSNSIQGEDRSGTFVRTPNSIP
jgi:hypothetical protein